MKKTAMAAALSLLVLTGCQGEQPLRLEYIGEQAAIAAASEEAGLQNLAIGEARAILADREGTEYYEVAFSTTEADYSYDVDALTGVVLRGNMTTRQIQDPIQTTSTPSAAPVQIASPANEKVQTPPPSVTNESVPSSKPSPVQAAGTPAVNEAGGAKDIGEEKAKSIALGHCGLDASQVVFLKCEIDWEHGQKVYDVEFYTQDGMEYDYEIGADGTIVGWDQDAERYAPPPAPAPTQSTTQGNGLLTQDQAIAIALEKVPGATQEHVTQCKLDWEDGRQIYEGELFYQWTEYEFEIDAYSGAILSWSAETD